MNTLLQIDTLDDRREIWSLLHRLSPRCRVFFLEYVCQLAARPGRSCPVPVPEMVAYARDARRCDRADDRLTNMVYADTLAVSAQYDVDMGRVAVALERYVKSGELAAFTSASSPLSLAPARTPDSTSSGRRAGLSAG